VRVKLICCPVGVGHCRMDFCRIMFGSEFVVLSLLSLGSRDNGRGLLEGPERGRLKKRGEFRFLEENNRKTRSKL